MDYHEIFPTLEGEFLESFQNAGLSLGEEYAKVIGQSKENLVDADAAYEYARVALAAILEAYANSKAKTEGGRWGRFFAGILAKITRVFKIKRNK